MILLLKILDDVEDLAPSRVEQEKIDDELDTCIKGLAAVFCRLDQLLKVEVEGLL